MGLLGLQQADAAASRLQEHCTVRSWCGSCTSSRSTSPHGGCLPALRAGAPGRYLDKHVPQTPNPLLHMQARLDAHWGGTGRGMAMGRRVPQDLNPLLHMQARLDARWAGTRRGTNAARRCPGSARRGRRTCGGAPRTPAMRRGRAGRGGRAPRCAPPSIAWLLGRVAEHGPEADVALGVRWQADKLTCCLSGLCAVCA